MSHGQHQECIKRNREEKLPPLYSFFTEGLRTLLHSFSVSSLFGLQADLTAFTTFSSRDRRGRDDAKREGLIQVKAHEDLEE